MVKLDRSIAFCVQCQIQFPAKGLVYDYNIDSILNKSDEDEEEEEGEGKDKKVSTYPIRQKKFALVNVP